LGLGLGVGMWVGLGLGLGLRLGLGQGRIIRLGFLKHRQPGATMVPPNDATRYELARDATLAFLARKEFTAFAVLLIPFVLGFGGLWFFLLIGLHTLGVRPHAVPRPIAPAPPCLTSELISSGRMPGPNLLSFLATRLPPSETTLTAHRSLLTTRRSPLTAHRAIVAACPGRASPLLAEQLHPGPDRMHGLRRRRLPAVPRRQRRPPVLLPPQLNGGT
jgi:hypothetical protein